MMTKTSRRSRVMIALAAAVDFRRLCGRGSRRVGGGRLRLARRAHLDARLPATRTAPEAACSDPAVADSEPGSDVNRPGTPCSERGAAAPLRLRHRPDGRPLRRGLARHADGQRLLRRPRRPGLDLRPAAPDRPRGPAGVVRHEVVPQSRSSRPMPGGRAMPVQHRRQRASHGRRLW